MALPANVDLPNYPFPAVARTFDFEFLRLVQQALIQHTAAEGIAGASTDLAMTATSGLGVSVAAGRAFVKGDDRATQGSYFCYVPAAQTATATAAHASNPRIDRVVLRVYDADVTGSQTKWAIEIIAGTPTAGATLSNLTGAAAVPNGALLLYNLLVPAAFAGPFVAGTHFQDRRFNVPIAGRELFGGRSVFTTTASTSSGMDATSNTVIGDGSTPVVVAFECGYITQSVAAALTQQSLRDGAAGTGTQYQLTAITIPGANYQTNGNWSAYVAAFSGSKTFYNYLTPSGGGFAQIAAGATQPARMSTRWA